MKALIVPTGRLIVGLGDPIPQALFAHTTVGESVRNALMAHGVLTVEDASQLADDDAVVVLGDDVFFTSTVAGDFISACARGTGVQRLALRRTPSVEFGLPLQPVTSVPLDPGEACTDKSGLAAPERAATHKVLYDVFFCRGRDVKAGGADVLGALRAVGQARVVEKREIVTDVRLPLLPMKSEEAPRMAFPVTSSVVMQLRHWVHVLWLNQLAPGIILNLSLRQNKVGSALRALSAFSIRRERVMEKLSVIHPTARVHPSAYVEASVIGPGVVLGPRASVRQSVVCEGAEVGEHATVLGSVVGCRTYVTPRTFLVWCALYPDSVVGNQKMQVSLVGHHCHVNAWVGLIDARFQGHIRVELDGQLQSTGRNFLGSCVGHECQLASKVLIHPGRAIPRGTLLVMRPDEVISTVPVDLPAGVPLVRDQGTLRPLSALKGA